MASFQGFPLFSKEQRLSRRFFLLVLFFSLVALLVSTALTFWFGYRKGIERIETNVQFIRESYVPVVATSLFRVDEDQLSLLLKGMNKLEGVVYSRVLDQTGTGRLELSEGIEPSAEAARYDFPLVYRSFDGQAIPLGTLSIFCDFSSVTSRLWETISLQVATFSIMIVAGALLVMLLFQKTVARHLFHMADFARGIDLGHLEARLRLDRRTKNDELEQVASAINSLQDRLQRDIEERKATERKLRESEAFRQRIFESSRVPIIVMDYETLLYIDCNPAAVAIYRFSSKEETLTKRPLDVSAPIQHDGTPSAESAPYYIEKAIAEGMVVFEWRHQRPDGEVWDAEVHLMSFKNAGRQLLQFTLYDITERKRSEEEKEKLQAQLLRAQKMEAIGHLAGGIAHDFNNMLSIVAGNTELVMLKAPHDDSARRRIEAIQEATRRSTSLVRQLLAFAKKQTIQPVVLDVNDTITGMLKVLRRLIGEDIHLAWVPGHETDKVKIDPSQIDQILTNLLVNARDAIDGVGKVTIETSNKTLDAAYCASHHACRPGCYVLLAVSDNGCGMDDSTVEKIFEPFFTTKAVDQGTGLGLATVYGIVQQNRGHIQVYSEPGTGTTFKIYLPAVETAAEPAENAMSDVMPPQGNETILVVEDDEAILEMVESILGQLGYRVLTAHEPHKAIGLVKTFSGKIHMLITDVIMPLMNGRELADQITQIIPDIKCLYMSGYPDNAIDRHGVLEDGMRFLPKPFSIFDLARKVRETLDRESSI